MPVGTIVRTIIWCIAAIVVNGCAQLDKQVDLRKQVANAEFSLVSIGFSDIGLSGTILQPTLRHITLKPVLRVINSGTRDLQIDKLHLDFLLDGKKLFFLAHPLALRVTAQQDAQTVLFLKFHHLSLEQLLNSQQLRIKGTVDIQVVLINDALSVPITVTVDTSISMDAVHKKLQNAVKEKAKILMPFRF